MFNAEQEKNCFLIFYYFFYYNLDNTVLGMIKMTEKRYYQNPKELGDSFERRVMKAFERINYVLVQKNQWNRNYALDKDKASKREYDLVMFNTTDCQFYIIECKAHYKPTNYVQLKQLAEFNHKLRNNNGRSARRVIVTDTDFTTRAMKYADKNNILLVNGKELGRIEEKGQTSALLTNRIMRAGLEHLVRGLMNNYFRRIGGG